MKRGQVFVRAQTPSGKWVSADVLDLDEQSFKLFVLDRMIHFGMVTILRDDVVIGEHLPYRTTVEGES